MKLASEMLSGGTEFNGDIQSDLRKMVFHLSSYKLQGRQGYAAGNIPRHPRNIPRTPITHISRNST